MAEIIVLPTVELIQARIERMTNDLSTAFESGASLGTRLPHMQKQLVAIHSLVQKLTIEVDAFVDNHDIDEELKIKFLQAMNCFISNLEISIIKITSPKNPANLDPIS